MELGLIGTGTGVFEVLVLVTPKDSRLSERVEDQGSSGCHCFHHVLGQWDEGLKG